MKKNLKRARENKVSLGKVGENVLKKEKKNVANHEGSAKMFGL